MKITHIVTKGRAEPGSAYFLRSAIAQSACGGLAMTIAIPVPLDSHMKRALRSDGTGGRPGTFRPSNCHCSSDRLVGRGNPELHKFSDTC